jgi:23S rRNA pseudouridine1911/1915/1917 synthase
MEADCLKIVVSSHKAKERIDTFLTREISRVSRSQIQRLIREGHISVDGSIVKSHHIVRPGETILVHISRKPPPDIIPESIPLEIIFEDSDLLVVNKPAGMVVHPAYGHMSGTLVNALMAHCRVLSDVNEPDRPGIVHRIDKDTSGLLVVAKNNEVHANLAVQFSTKSVQREYSAIVWGRMAKNRGTIETKLSRSMKDRRKIRVSADGKVAITHFEVIERFPLTTLVRLKLGTGRTHQIRVHLSHMRHPVFGDQAYGGRGRQLGGLNRQQRALASGWLEMIDRQALHAGSLGFIHPISEESHLFHSPLPDDIATLLSRMRETKHRVEKEKKRSR